MKEAGPASETSCALNKSHTKVQLNIIITNKIASKNKLKVDSTRMCGDSSQKIVFISSTRVLVVQFQKMVLFRNTSCQTTRHIQENCRFCQTTRHIASDVALQEGITAPQPTTNRELHVLQFSNAAFSKSDNLEPMWYEEKWRLFFKYSFCMCGRLKKTSFIIAYRQKGIRKRHHRSKGGGGGVNKATGRVSQLVDGGREEYNKESQCNELQVYTACYYGV
jgi:hypothetical protein